MHPLAIKSLVNLINSMSVHKSETQEEVMHAKFVISTHVCQEMALVDAWGVSRNRRTPLPDAGWVLGVVVSINSEYVGRLPFSLFDFFCYALLLYFYSSPPFMFVISCLGQWMNTSAQSHSLGTLATHFLGGKAKLGDWSLSVVKATFSWGCGKHHDLEEQEEITWPSCWNVSKSCAFKICAEYGKYSWDCREKGIPNEDCHVFVTWLNILCSPSTTLPQL